jgi:hypothetical protein
MRNSSQVRGTDGPRWHDTCTKAHGDQFRQSSNINVFYLNNFRCYSVGITNERDL